MADVTIDNLTGQTPTTSDVFPFSTTGVTPSTYKATLAQIKSGLALSQTDITTALGFIPYNSTNPNNFITTANLHSFRDYGTSQTTSTNIEVSSTKIRIGYISIGPNTYKDISNLPYTSINSYVAFVQNNGLEPGQGTNAWTLGVPEKISASVLRVWSQSDHTMNVNWMAIGY